MHSIPRSLATGCLTQFRGRAATALAFACLAWAGAHAAVQSHCQEIKSPGEDWRFGTSDQTRAFLRAEHFQCATAATGFSLRCALMQFTPTGWRAGEENRMSLQVRVFADEGGQPGTLLHEWALSTTPQRLDEYYGGVVQLRLLHVPLDPQWELREGWLSLQGVSSSGSLWLWGGATQGDGLSALDRGQGWEWADFDLNLCVEEFALEAPSVGIGLEGDCVRLSWKAVPEAQHYQVWRAEEEGIFLPVEEPITATSWLDTDTTLHQLSRYRVTALLP